MKMMNVIVTPNNVSAAAAAAAPGVAPVTDGMLDRLVKLVPTEVIAGYTALLAITASIDRASARWATPIALVACSVLVVMALVSAGRSQARRVTPPLAQYVLSILAFWAWAVTIRDPLEAFGVTTPLWIGPFCCVLIPTFGAFFMGAAIKDDRTEREARAPVPGSP